MAKQEGDAQCILIMYSLQKVLLCLLKDQSVFGNLMLRDLVCRIAVIAAASAFGVLHVGGGRNAAFAIWAIFVGLIYGGAYLYTHDLFVPAFAHSLANYASASLWLSSRSQQTH